MHKYFSTEIKRKTDLGVKKFLNADIVFFLTPIFHGGFEDPSYAWIQENFCTDISLPFNFVFHELFEFPFYST